MDENGSGVGLGNGPNSLGDDNPIKKNGDKRDKNNTIFSLIFLDNRI